MSACICNQSAHSFLAECLNQSTGLEIQSGPDVWAEFYKKIVCLLDSILDWTRKCIILRFPNGISPGVIALFIYWTTHLIETLLTTLPTPFNLLLFKFSFKVHHI